MPEVSATELLAQLRGFVELLSAPAAFQLAWLTKERVPVDELMLQLDDSVPGWFPRLREAGLLAQAAEQRLLDLNHELDRLREYKSLWTDEALKTAAEWQHVRNLARHALTAMATGS